jgi:hypothetical protein
MKKTITYLFVAFVCKSFSQISVQSYTTPGSFTFTVPLSVTSITAEVIGAGGHGIVNGGGGGGGGGYASGVYVVVPGSTLNVKVGAAGSGSVLGASSVVSLLSASGGENGFSLSPNTIIGGSGAGGVGTGGTIANRTGGSGGNGCNTYIGAGGGGAAGPLANGTNGGNTNAAANTATLCGIAGAAAGGTAGVSGGSPAGNGGVGSGFSGTGCSITDFPGGFGTNFGGGGGSGNGNGSPAGLGAGGYCIISWNACSGTTPTITSSAPSTSICSGQTVTLTASGVSSYSWNTSATTASITISPALTTTYSVVGTNSLGCSATATTIVNVTTNPSLFFVGGSTVICVGQTATLTTGGATTYTWNTGATATSITPTPTISSTYTVNASYGVCSYSATASVTVNALPNVLLTANNNTVCVNSASIALNGTPSGGTYSGTNVTGAIFTPGAVAGTFTPTYAYTNTVTGCSKTATTSILVVVCDGLFNNSYNSNAIKAYPNPNSGILTIELANGKEKVIQVSDITGRIVLEYTTTEDLFDLKISSLTNGIYYLKVTSNSSSDVVKLIKR